MKLTATTACRRQYQFGVAAFEASTICRAARSAFIEVTGKASLMLNQAYSARCFL